MTPDNAGQTTSGLLEELGAKASPRPWRALGGMVGCPASSSVGRPEKFTEIIGWPEVLGDFKKSWANADLTAIAANHLPPVVAALEEAGCLGYPDEGGCSTMLGERRAGWCESCLALADLRTALTEALAATKEAQDG